jgi:hypothetical protein
MTKKTTKLRTSSGAVKGPPASKKPRKKKEAPSFDLKPVEAMLGLNPTHEEFEDVFKQLKKAFIERILSAELSDHLGYERGGEKASLQRHPG